MTKTIEKSFIDWEANVFGFGYGTGEEHVLRSLKLFFDLIGKDQKLPNSYNYEQLEQALTAPVAWLIINILCHADIIEYGSSPRFGWLDKKGIALKAFVDTKTVGELVDLCCDHTEDDIICYPDSCNCGPNGYEKGKKCYNPFWSKS